jgi:hypothetical protein
VFENKALRGIFGPKRWEATVQWKKLRSENLKQFQICTLSKMATMIIKENEMNGT